MNSYKLPAREARRDLMTHVAKTRLASSYAPSFVSSSLLPSPSRRDRLDKLGGTGLSSGRSRSTRNSNSASRSLPRFLPSCAIKPRILPGREPFPFRSSVNERNSAGLDSTVLKISVRFSFFFFFFTFAFCPPDRENAPIDL